ncbi:hypothetical protein B0T17DRAFT_306257 [Bombardia bombarda]|uniref:Uncharacterized protein n=1 Tax=Bombardia bombarda TaxID=252184 RepID=A0AA40C2E9_9PEZI|nr:hypothetical protein B0T17DRAFT_306257 [Bombardia bombarda]
MVGETPESAIPHIMFACSKAGPRKEALRQFRESKILHNHPPGIETGHWDYPPHIINPRQLGSGSTGHMESTIHHSMVGKAISFMQFQAYSFETKEALSPAAVQIILSPKDDASAARAAAIGGIVVMEERAFLITAAHVALPDSETRIDNIVYVDDSSPDDELEFGGFDMVNSPFGDDDDGSLSVYCITPEATGTVDSDQKVDSWLKSCMDIRLSLGDGQNDSESSGESSLSSQIPGNPTLQLPGSPSLASLESHAPVQRGRLRCVDASIGLDDASISTISFSVCRDYMLIELNPSSQNAFSNLGLPRISRANTSAPPPHKVQITTTLNSTGVITGTLSGSPSYVRLPNSHAFRQVFTISLDFPLHPGDCGATILDASSQIVYGHIVAGSQVSRVAYMMPVLDVLDDIEQMIQGGPTDSTTMNYTVAIESLKIKQFGRQMQGHFGNMKDSFMAAQAQTQTTSTEQGFIAPEKNALRDTAGDTEVKEGRESTDCRGT